MAIDPSIAMGFKPPQIDSPINAMSQVQGLINARTQNQLAQQNLLAQKTEMDRQNALRQTLQGVDPNSPEGRTTIQQAYMRAGDAKGALEFASNATKLDKDQRDKELADIKLRQEKVGAVSQTAAALFAKPNLTFDDVKTAEADLTKKGYLTPEESQAQLAQWQADPAFAQNPTQFLRDKLGVLAKQGMSAHDTLEQQKLHFLSTGDQILGVDPNTGQPKTTYKVNASPNVSLRMSFGVTPEENDALSKAITEGRLDPYKVNSRNASVLAHAEMSNPGVDLNGLAGNAAMLRNVNYQQKAEIARTIPSLIGNVVEAGKKLGFSDVKLVGRMQAWGKGELNDPNFTEYMQQRNDNLMAIASAARGVGMSDFATKMENEIASPTMSPAALDAWGRGQMKSMMPRIEMYKKHALYNRPGAAGTAPPAGEGAPAAAADSGGGWKDL